MRIASITFQPNESGTPAGKLADAALHFSGGPFDGLKLEGFSVWARGTGGYNVVLPGRQYTINGERRVFTLLRPVADPKAGDRVRDLILEAWIKYAAAEDAAKYNAKRNTGSITPSAIKATV